MAKRKKKKPRPRKISFGLRSPKKKNIKKRFQFNWPSAGLLKPVAAICLLAATGLSLLFLDSYVKTVVPIAESKGPIELAGSPDWVSPELKERIIATAGTGQSSFQLDDDAARSVAQNLASFAWLAEYQVQTTGRTIKIKAEFRKPVALIKAGRQKFYVDENLVVLDYTPIPKLPIVLIKGVQALTAPPAGQPWQRDDLQAAVELLALLHKMDAMVAAKQPLINEIQVVDVSNFQGRRDRREPHILLYATDETQIIWGAEPGSSHQCMEAREDEKLAMLYSFYEETGTLANRVKYIELRYPRKNIPQPLNSF
jgi:cell division septal protein FtsQ